MAKTDEQVMDLVKAELQKNPDIKSSALFEIAKSAVPSIGKLSVRQFHARYPLQIKRDKAFASGGARKAARGGARKAKSRAGRSKAASTTKPAKKTAAAPVAPTGGVDRDRIRQAFMRFAADLSAAEARKDLVKVIAGVDRYVDEAVKALG